MNSKNIQLIQKIAKEASQTIPIRFIDNRWKKHGDIDIIVAKGSIKQFENILRHHNFKRKGMFPPQSRTYKAFHNNELISIGAHVGGYIGGFGGGLGRLGKILEPKDTSTTYLTAAEQMFIILYKYATRKEKQKYEAYYNELLKEQIDEHELEKLCIKAFSNPTQITKQVASKEKLSTMKMQLKPSQKFRLFFRGKPNKIARRLYRIFKPAPFVAIVGCNGTGKSTTVKKVAEKLESENLDVARYYSGRMKFQMLPINVFLRFFKPDKIEGKESKDQKVKYEREVRIFHSKTLNFIAPFVYYVEYTLRYIFKIYPKQIFNDIVLTDRSFIDVFASPNMNKKVCKFLFKLMPQPYHILLWNEPEVIAARRPEFLLEHIKQQCESYDQFDKNNFYIIKIKTDKFEVTDEIAARIAKLV
ncbi:MAG TPA: hypothetical protein VJB66_05710 [Candidatus Nanoarchaeia archaeon]|nr:hypothetical protein [Candidatus Nanoarchaeia archaeon]